MRFSILYRFIALPCICQATYFGNPAEPVLLSRGLIKEKGSSIRVGYMADHLYRQNYKDEFPSPGTHPPSNYTKMNMQAGTITLTLRKRLDLNGILGSARMQIDQDVFTKRQFAWGVGGKLIILKSGNLYLGLDAKYLESAQKPTFFLADGYAYNIVSNFKLNYTEMQAALGAAYKTTVLSPYIYLTYLYSKIDPDPFSVIVQIPFLNMTALTSSHSIINQTRWGMAVGGTLLSGKKMSLNVESRLFNQNAINVSGEFRF